jgi:segregation and condensation protein B
LTTPDLRPWVQTLIFCATEPITVEQLDACLTEALGIADLTAEQILDAIDAVDAQLAASGMAFRVRAVAGGYQLLTEPAYQAAVEALIKQKSRRRLSTSMLETLAIIAYKQPITKQTIEQIRGVGCDYAVQKLLEKELIELRGKAETVGRPVLYGTTPRFLHGFGLNDLRDLPQLRDVTADEDATPVLPAEDESLALPTA